MIISTKNRKIGYVYSSVSGKFPFRKQKSIAFESKLEEAFLTKFAFNDAVVDILEQPFTLEYETKEGRIATYTPDFFVTFSHEEYWGRVNPYPLIVEVKPREILRKKFCEFYPKFKAVIAYAAQSGYRFKIYDEGRIKDTYYKNVLFLRRYLRIAYDNEDGNRIMEYLEASGHSRIDVVTKFLGITEEHQGVLIGQIWSMLANKVIETNMHEPLRHDTVVWINKDKGGQYGNR